MSAHRYLRLQDHVNRAGHPCAGSAAACPKRPGLCYEEGLGFDLGPGPAGGGDTDGPVPFLHSDDQLADVASDAARADDDVQEGLLVRDTRLGHAGAPRR